jgi:hypothetical protein
MRRSRTLFAASRSLILCAVGACGSSPGQGATASVVIRDTTLVFDYAITGGERVLYVSDRDSFHADGSPHFVVKRATRSDPNAAFGELVPVPELALAPDLDLRVDWVSEDECVLYGTVGNTTEAIYRAVRGS